MTSAPEAGSPPRFFRPTWAEIDLGRLKENLRRFKSKMGRGSALCMVVKGNAYGHGAAAVSQAAQDAGAAWLGVSSVEEGIALREAGLRPPILILGSLYPFESFLAAVRYGLTPTVASLEAAQRLAEVARTLDAGVRVRCHLKLDTGMGRIGMGWPSGLRAVEFIAGERRLELEGVYTHLACADTDREYTRLQLRRFRGALEDIRRRGVRLRWIHAANSTAALSFPASRFNLVRPGLAVYGLCGSGFKPVLSLKSRIVFIKNVQAGTPISYGRTFRSRKASRIATLPIGYADGFPRSLSNRAEVLVRGRRCPVVGAITMDMAMIDVTGVPEARVGDETILLGENRGMRVTAGDWAGLAGTIPYEVVVQISSRVPRVYLDGRSAASARRPIL